MIEDLFINDIKIIAERIEGNKFNCDCIYEILTGEIQIQQINDEYKKIIIRNISRNINMVVVDCIRNEVKSLSLNGNLNINPTELYQMFSNFREVFSVHDNLFFYFFNEDKKNGKCIVSFFEPSHKKINVVETVKNISNVTLSWK